MDKKELIIEAAKKAFRQYGIFKTTLDDVGNFCGMRKNSLYYYFKNKESLFRETMRSEFVGLIKKEKDLISETAPLKEFLKQYFIFRYTESVKFLKEYELMKFESQQVYHQIFHEETEYLLNEECKVIKSMTKDKVSDDTDIEALITIIISINQGLLYKSLFSHETLPDIDNDINTIINFLFNGIKLKNN